MMVFKDLLSKAYYTQLLPFTLKCLPLEHEQELALQKQGQEASSRQSCCHSRALMAKPGLADILSAPGRHLMKDLTNLRNILCKENFQDPMTVFQCNKI